LTIVAQTVTLVSSGPPGVPGIFKGQLIGQRVILPFCGVCGYSTGSVTWVKRHHMTHTGERPFECPSCDYTATRKYTMKVHMARNHPTRLAAVNARVHRNNF
jgi:hypothetical protein